jgi:CheY-like chemotaxis protein
MSRAQVAVRSPASDETVRVMLVDDEPTTLLVVESFLREEGFEDLVILDDSRQALDLVSTMRPDVLLLDMMMPHVGGFEILASMQAAPALADIPVIILSGGDEADMRQALSLGAADFLPKPVERGELARRLREALAVKTPESA